MLGTRIDSAPCSIGLAVFAYSSHIQRHERGSGTMGELSVWKKHLVSSGTIEICLRSIGSGKSTADGCLEPPCRNRPDGIRNGPVRSP